MIVKVDWTGAKETTAREYVIRFVFGGSITAAAGLIGKAWGPVVAGLFLAFPAIFPASLTLVERHERERKAQKGLRGAHRAITAAADYAMGTALGSLALLSFAVACWKLLPKLPTAVVLAGGTLLWAAAAGLAWLAVKRWRWTGRR